MSSMEGRDKSEGMRGLSLSPFFEDEGGACNFIPCFRSHLELEQGGPHCLLELGGLASSLESTPSQPLEVGFDGVTLEETTPCSRPVVGVLGSSLNPWGESAGFAVLLN